MPFFIATPQLLGDFDLTGNHIQTPPQGSHLFGKGSFVTFDPANLEAIGNKHAVSDSVFQRSPIIIVVGYRCN